MDKPLLSLGLSVFFFYRTMHDLIHGRDTGGFQAYKCPVLVQKMYKILYKKVVRLLCFTPVYFRRQVKTHL